jgi:hypothetical protein
VERAIDGFHEDENGEWVADLSCLHRQHVRHQPPFRDRPWVLTEEGRADHIGAPIECPLCDRTELPDGLALARTAGPFTADSLPAGLRRDHQVADGTWGVVRIVTGGANISLDTTPPIDRDLSAGDAQPIPPGVIHRVRLTGPVLLAVDFLTRTPG